MLVSGFTILRDGVRFDYPFVESIHSILPLVDEFIVLVGDCSDNTRERLRAINSPKLVLLDSVWDPAMRKGGQVLAYQTNLALERCQGDWCFYLQADEVIHENDLDRLEAAMQRHRRRPSVEGLMFRYHHFMGDYSIRNPLPYRRQVRIIRNHIGARSVGDACGFALENGRKLQTVSSGAWVYHYGWVRPPSLMGQKQIQLGIFYVEDEGAVSAEAGRKSRQAELQAVAGASPWDFDLSACTPFHQSHPAVMTERIAKKDWPTPLFRFVPWWRNPAWWQGLCRKNFASLGRLWGTGRLPTAG